MRDVLGIPARSEVLMFSAVRLDRPWKGADLLIRGLRELPSSLRSETVVLLLGRASRALVLALENDVGVKTIECGWVGSDALKAALYSAADLYVHPTRADSLPLVLQESLACGTQAVSFNVGGVSDLVRPGETGYLAAPENVADLSRALSRCLRMMRAGDGWPAGVAILPRRSTRWNFR